MQAASRTGSGDREFGEDVTDVRKTAQMLMAIDRLYGYGVVPNMTELEEELISVCRTAIGDEVRSITYFTPDDYEQLYLREGLEQDADIGRFVNNERLGFASQQTYGDTELGEYEFTIRVFEWGYVTRVIVDELGVYVTTDPLKMDGFKEVATAVRRVLAGDGEPVTIR